MKKKLKFCFTRPCPKNAVIMLILYLQKALCLKLSLDIFATNIEKVLKKIYILCCFYK